MLTKSQCTRATIASRPRRSCSACSQRSPPASTSARALRSSAEAGERSQQARNRSSARRRARAPAPSAHRCGTSRSESTSGAPPPPPHAAPLHSRTPPAPSSSRSHALSQGLRRASGLTAKPAAAISSSSSSGGARMAGAAPLAGAGPPGAALPHTASRMATYSRGPGRGAAARVGRAAMSLARRSTDSPRARIDRPAPRTCRCARQRNLHHHYVTVRAHPVVPPADATALLRLNTFATRPAASY
ncbi:unnamed protein product [Arctia plantaginis]|uniref:Uncharacterized protein n=1 Tax=Arctia plantaginis TaxID=874455 RepID=A0A8S0ZRT7_ARCPL|nr:unnamed protein product [Arctia plantaginis]